MADPVNAPDLADTVGRLDEMLGRCMECLKATGPTGDRGIWKVRANELLDRRLKLTAKGG